jgi:hypothetical protein
LKSRPSYGNSRSAVTDRNLCLSFPQHLHFVFRNGELRQTAIQTYRKLRPHQDDGLVQTFEARKMKRNFAVKRLLIVRIASPARHGSRPRVSSTKGAVGEVIPITPDRPKITLRRPIQPSISTNRSPRHVRRAALAHLGAPTRFSIRPHYKPRILQIEP